MRGWRHKALAGWVCAAVVLALAAPAGAQQGTGDPSAFEQYVEDVPGARGDQPSRDTELNAGGGEQLPPEAEAQLEEFGSAGEQAAALAESTGPKVRRDSGGNGVRREGDGGIGSVLEEIFSPNAAGIGFILPLILIGVLIAGLAYALNRRFSKPEAPI